MRPIYNTDIKEFIREDFLLHSAMARTLYHEFAEKMPILDYHSHLSPEDIAKDRKFENLTRLWLEHDHYKWRAMRACGVNEEYCSGKGSDRDKFIAWAATVPKTLRNPLFHWTHLELKRYFGIDEMLNAENAEEIYDRCNEMLQSPEFSTRALLKKMNVALVGTTDDPTDTLEHHQQVQMENFEVKMLPTFRADQALALGSASDFLAWLARLEKSVGYKITSLGEFLEALRKRHQFFHRWGCRISDQGLEYMLSADYTLAQLERLFVRLCAEENLNAEEKEIFASGILHQLAVMHYERGWVQQYHLGALRNVRSDIFASRGPDMGFDAIGDWPQAQPLVRFLDRLQGQDQLARTILYNLNPADSESVASIAFSFNDGRTKHKMQYGPAWWFLDQKEGILRHLNTLSNLGMLTGFVGMVTDSRSLMSFPRHEYFRRVLCNLLGSEMENGELPEDIAATGKLVQDICFYNAKSYFNL